MNKIILIVILFVIGVLVSSSVSGQLSPPGLGKTNSASWLAIGLGQELDSLGQKESMTYFGMGRISGLANSNPFHKLAILVVNQEYYNQFRKHWQYSLALSYRRQNEYETTAPYEIAPSGTKQEFRVYGRFVYIWQKSRLKITPTVRQEFRKFYTTDFHDWSESYQFRTRLRVKLTFHMDKKKVHRLLASAEALFSIDRMGSSEKGWSNFGYHESRFYFYYSLSPQKLPLVFNLGYMNNLIGTNNLKDAHFLAFDVVIKDPFRHFKEGKSIEYFE